MGRQKGQDAEERESVARAIRRAKKKARKIKNKYIYIDIK